MIKRFNLLIFILLVMFESYLDPDVTRCSRSTGKLLLLAHHILSVYILTGSILLGYPEFHVVVSITVIILWIKYSRCVTSIYNNKLCSFDNNYKFKNYFFHIRNYLQVDYYIAEAFIFKIFLLLLFDLYLILRDSYNIGLNDVINYTFYNNEI